MDRLVGETRRERERENGHENIYIECASGALLLQPTRPLFVLLSPVGLFPTSPLSLLRSTLCRSPSFYPPDKRRQPPTDSSANSVSELQDFSLPPLPPLHPLFLVSRPCLALHGPRLSLENPGVGIVPPNHP